MNDGLWRTSVFVGGVITFAFGIWHTFVPTLYGWGNYMTSVPDELTRAILATNFFLGLSLSIFGAVTIVMGLWMWGNLAVVRLWVWSMSFLWAVRVAYQALNPQGRLVPGLAVFLLIVFALADLCFLIPAVMLKE